MFHWDETLRLNPALQLAKDGKSFDAMRVHVILVAQKAHKKRVRLAHVLVDLASFIRFDAHAASRKWEVGMSLLACNGLVDTEREGPRLTFSVSLSGQLRLLDLHAPVCHTHEL